MASEITENGFKEELKAVYKDDGDYDIDTKISILYDHANKTNKDNNPFYLRTLLETIKQENIKINELVQGNRTNSKTYSVIYSNTGSSNKRAITSR